MKILITGIAGFIGSQIALNAIEREHTVFGVDDLSQGKLDNVPNGCTFLQYDLANKDLKQYLPKDIDIILHLAGQSSGEISFDDPVVDLKKNVISTLNLIEYGISIKAKKIIYASSMSVYGITEDRPITEQDLCQPLSCYGVGKLAAENYLKIYQNQLPFVSLRMFNVYGPGQDLNNLRQGMVSIYLAYANKTGHIPVKGSLDRFRDFIFISDVVNIWMQCLENEQIYNKIFNLGTGIKTTVFSLLQQIKTLYPKLTWKEQNNTIGDQFGIYADPTFLRENFKFDKFITLADGLKIFSDWTKNQCINIK